MILGLIGPEDAAAPGAIYLEVGLAALLGYVVLYGLRATYVNTLGALLRKAADLFTAKVPFTNIGIPGGGAIASVFDKTDHFVQRQMGSGLLALETVIAKWWHSLEWVARTTADSIAAFAGDVHDGFRILVQGYIPTLVQGATHPVTVGLGKLGARMAALEHSLELKLGRTARALEREIEYDFGKAWRGIDHVRGSLGGTLSHLAHIFTGELEALRHYAHRILNHRITKLEKRLGAGVLGAVIIATLTRVWPWWKCSNVRRFNRSLCRSPIGALDWLFALAALESLLLDPKLVAQVGEEVASELESVVRLMGDL